MSTLLLTFSLLLVSSSVHTIDFETHAANKNLSPKILEGICRYESDHGRIKIHKNANGSWDVGLCQNHRKISEVKPKIPSDESSVKEAAREAAYWKKQHQHFCVNTYNKTGKCGYILYGKWRGVKNCNRSHYWWSHYNHGFRVLKNNYGRKVACFIKSGFKKCGPSKWKKMSYETSTF